MNERSSRVAWRELVAQGAALAWLLCAAWGCTGPGLEPPRDQAGAGTGGGFADAGSPPQGGSAGAAGTGGSSGSGGFAPTGGAGGIGGDGDGLDAGEGDMDGGVDDEDGGADVVRD